MAFRLHAPIPVYVILAVLWLVAACSLYTLPVVWRPSKFAVPLSPLTPALGMFITLHLIGVPPPPPPPPPHPTPNIHSDCQVQLRLR